MEDYEEANEIDPSRGFPQMRLVASLRDDDYDEAVRRLRVALQHNPQQVATRFMLANMLERSGDPTAAKTEMRRVLDLKSDMWIAAYRLGQLHLRDREISAARPILERAVAFAPERAAPRLALGYALIELGENEQAVAVLEEARKLSRPVRSGDDDRRRPNRARAT